MAAEVYFPCGFIAFRAQVGFPHHDRTLGLRLTTSGRTLTLAGSACIELAYTLCAGKPIRLYRMLYTAAMESH